MANKPKFWRNVFLGIAIATGTLGVAAVVVPPMITLNQLRPRIAAAILARTGTPAQIRGNVHFSLMGGLTISAHDIVVPNGTVETTRFSLPISDLFRLQDAELTGNIVISGARIDVDRLVPVTFDNTLEIQNSFIEFYGKTYEIINAEINGPTMRGTVRTNQHKYEIDAIGDQFVIKNRANDLQITGRMYPDGTAHGTMELAAADINAWFEFSEPKIDVPVKLRMNFDWDGGYGFDFTDIRGENFAGTVRLSPDGARDIDMRVWDLTYDLSFLGQPTNIFRQTTLNLDLTGNLTFLGRTFHHVAVVVRGAADDIAIGRVVADDIMITGGAITADGARDMQIRFPINGKTATCLFSGTPDNWRCGKFTWGDYSGSLSVDGDTFNAFVQSTQPAPDMDDVISATSNLGEKGKITFQFADMAGTIMVDAAKTSHQMNFVQDKSLDWLGADMVPGFMPEFMRNDVGNFIWTGDVMEFTPHSGRWHLSTQGRTFALVGGTFRDLIPGTDVPFVRDMDYQISGTFDKNNIADLRLRIGDNEFTGTYADGVLTLNTDVLNLDGFTDQSFVDNYEELAFRVNSPVMVPFDFARDVSIAAGTVIYNGNAYKNFAYALKPDVQTLSVSDNDRGNLLVRIVRDKKNYQISVMMDRFVTTAPLMNATMPINVTDTVITGMADMTTSGQIAYDIEHNLRGNLDMTLTGGTLVGIGLDDFYASAENITTLNAEMMLGAALDGGASRIKQIHIIGRYGDGNFETTRPLTLEMRHVDATGTLRISDGRFMMDLNMIMRGTSPAPMPVQLRIDGGARDYSLSQIMINLDPGYMRDFIKNHNRF